MRASIYHSATPASVLYILLTTGHHMDAEGGGVEVAITATTMTQPRQDDQVLISHDW